MGSQNSLILHAQLELHANNQLPSLVKDRMFHLATEASTPVRAGKLEVAQHLALLCRVLDVITAWR